MNWSRRYAMSKFSMLSAQQQESLNKMCDSLNSHVYKYIGRSGQDETQRMYQGAGGADIDNQHLLRQQRSTFSVDSPGAIGRAAQQISLFTGKQSYVSDVRTNEQAYPELHYMINNANASRVPALHRGIVLYGKDAKEEYKPGQTVSTGVTSTSSDPELARAWVKDDMTRHTADGTVSKNSYVNLHFPAGSQALQVAPLSEVPEHNEYAIAKSSYTVGRVEGPDADGIHHVYLEHGSGQNA